MVALACSFRVIYNTWCKLEHPHISRTHNKQKVPLVELRRWSLRPPLSTTKDPVEMAGMPGLIHRESSRIVWPLPRSHFFSLSNSTMVYQLWSFGTSAHSILRAQTLCVNLSVMGKEEKSSSSAIVARPRLWRCCQPAYV